MAVIPAYPDFILHPPSLTSTYKPIISTNISSMTYTGTYYQTPDIYASTSTAGADYYASQPLAGHHGASYQDLYESKPIIRRTQDALYPSVDYRSTQPPTMYASYQQPQAQQQHQHSTMSDFEDMYNGSAGPITHSPPQSQSPDLPAAEHNYITVMELSHRQILNLYVRHLPSGNRRSLACKYSRCSYPSAFRTEEEAVQHVTSAHLNQSWEGFVCLTCGVLMARKQDAVRHVKTMNAGKKYECAVCHKTYARKDYRNIHQTRCSSNFKYPADSNTHEVYY